jgi:transposase-like protein
VRGGNDTLLAHMEEALDAGYSRRAIAKILGVSNVAVCKRLKSGLDTCFAPIANPDSQPDPHTR